MSQLEARAELDIRLSSDQLFRIRDRLESFEGSTSERGDAVDFRFAFGEATVGLSAGSLLLRARSANADGLSRVKELMATAVQVHAKDSKPVIVWQGDLAGPGELAQLRIATVIGVSSLTAHMMRIRFAAKDLERFEALGGLHVRMLFPTAAIPDPVWPVRGENGLVVWPDESRRPPARVYTIRRLDVEAGWFDVDFLVHDGDSVGSNWAVGARPGDAVGIMGPLGRPFRQANWYVLAADETGLPAIGRILEALPAIARGLAFVEVADESERQPLPTKAAVDVRWIYRDGAAAGESGLLADTVIGVEWPDNETAFGWFAAEAQAAKKVREYWRGTLGLGRDQTLAAAYWERGKAGTMAG